MLVIMVTKHLLVIMVTKYLLLVLSVRKQTITIPWSLKAQILLLYSLDQVVHTSQRVLLSSFDIKCLLDDGAARNQ